MCFVENCRPVCKAMGKLLLLILSFSIGCRVAARHVLLAFPQIHRLLFFVFMFLCQHAYSATSQLVSIDGVPFVVDVAISHSEQALGLSGLNHLPDNYGLLFYNSIDANHCLYMRDTQVPLTAIFLDETGLVLDVQPMQPNTENYHCAYSRYMLEVSSSWANQLNIMVGSVVDGLKF